ncbi:MAG: diguanylate cyclase [Patulibacter minatonensis]
MSSPRSVLAHLLDHGRQATDVSPEDLRQMRVTGTVEYLAGAATLLTVTLMPDVDTSDHRAYTLLALVGLLFAAARWLAPQDVRTVRLSLLVGFLYIGAIVSVARPLTSTPLYFIWPTLTAAYFLGRRGLAFAFAGSSVSFIAALAVNPAAQNAIQTFISTWAVIVIVGLLVTMLRERVDGLVHDLEHTASTDMLTGLVNRRTFETITSREIERARRSGQPLSIALFDLDHFKRINDRLGHAEGDRALRRFADLLRGSCRLVDVPARIGGEEFALLLSNADAEGARVYAERLLRHVLEETKDDTAPISVSIGITELSGPSDTLDVLLLAADRALYEAKHRGRARVIVARPATPSQMDHTGERLEIIDSAAGQVPVDRPQAA